MTPYEKKALKLAEIRGIISTAQVSRELGIEMLFAKDIMKKLIREDYLEKVEPGKYIPTAKKPPLKFEKYIIGNN